MKIVKRLFVGLITLVFLVGGVLVGVNYNVFPEAFELKVLGLVQKQSKRCQWLFSMLPRLGLAAEARPILQRFKQQQKIDDKLLAEYASGAYTLENPFVVVDPYGVAPLSALIMFATEKDCLIDINIKGNSEQNSIAYRFNREGYRKKHLLPVYGLYGNQENFVSIKAISKSGKVKEQTLSIVTEKLPSLAQQQVRSIKAYAPKDYQEGLNFSYSSVDYNGLKQAFDAEGKVRWLFSDRSLSSLGSYAEGVAYRAFGRDDTGTPVGTIITRESFLGRIEAMYYVPLGTHHELRVTEDNTLLIGTNHVNTVEDGMLEMDLSNGRIINKVDYDKLLPMNRKVGSQIRKAKDWAHMNSMVKYQGDYVSSSNLQSAVFRHTNNQLKWIFSDPVAYPKEYSEYLLKPVGEGFEYPYNQHSALVLPDYDNKPETVDILLFDNGDSRDVLGAQLPKDKKYSRMVHYRVNEQTKTVEQLWQYGKERPELFAQILGNVQLLDNGNILGCFSRGNEKGKNAIRDTIYLEVSKTGKVVWECQGTSTNGLNHYNDYRLDRLPLYDEKVDYSQLLKKAECYIPKEVMF